MIEQIGKIIDNGHAYAVDGDVYFSVPSLDGYGSLSGRKMEDNRAGERVEVDSRKRDPADFALWKAKKEGEPFWESPWGQVRYKRERERERVFDDKSYFIERYLYLSICGIFSIFLPQKLKYSQDAVPLYRGTPLGILWTRGPPCMRGYTAKRSFLQ